MAVDSVSFRSNAPIAAVMRERMESIGFEVEQLELIDPLGEKKVSLVGRRGPGRGGIAYFCHNDVVPVDGWNAAAGGPFDAVVSDGKLWGRGACDMKGSAAAALAALSQIPVEKQTAPITFVVTSDEEHGMHGARLVAEKSTLYRRLVEENGVGIIGEPTELNVVHAHKGGWYLHVTARGRAAHSSTAEGINANWQLIPFLSFLHEVKTRTESDPAMMNSDFDPPTMSMNMVIKNQPTAANITVENATCTIFLRLMPNTAWQPLADELCRRASDMGLEIRSPSTLSPVCTPQDSRFVQEALELATGESGINGRARTVSYATDGCWFTEVRNLIVLGPGSIQQAHRPDEFITLEQLSAGTELYRKFFERYAC